MIPLKKKFSKLALAIGTVAFLTSVTVNADTISNTDLTATQEAEISSFFAAPDATAGSLDIAPGEITLLSAKVTGLDSCDGDIGLSITNSFTDGTFEKIFENFSSVVKAVISVNGAIFLASLYLQKSNPGLYSLLTNGIGISIKNFLSGIASCEAMLRTAASYIPPSVVDAGRSDYLSTYLGDGDLDLSNVDITDFLSATPNDSDNSLIAKMKEGLPWYNSNGEEAKVGGEESSSGNQVAEIVKAGAKIGYCILRGVSHDDCIGSHHSASSVDADIELHPMFPIIFGTNSSKYKSKVQTLGVKLFGEHYFTNCDGCDNGTVAGMGLDRYFQDQTATVYSLIATRVSSNLSTLDSDNIKEMSAPPGITITAPYIKALQTVSDRPTLEKKLIKALATEVAYQRTLWVGNLYQRIWTGMEDDKRTKDAKFTGNFEELAKETREQIKTFVMEMNAQGFKVGKYSKAVLSINNSDGSVDSILQAMGAE